MAPTSLNKTAGTLSSEERRVLLDLAGASIKKGLCGEELYIKPEEHSSALQEHGASFVTLHVNRALRGCIGSLEAERPLVLDVVKNAYAAAFNDPRFSALTWPEFERLDIHLSILNMPEPMHFVSEQDLLKQLRPGLDGLILEEKFYRGTFLPSVWESVPEPGEFLRQLKRKAGLHPDYWSDTIRIMRYTTESIP
jgi:AmmeMemoRadiSam system protein A